MQNEKCDESLKKTFFEKFTVDFSLSEAEKQFQGAGGSEINNTKGGASEGNESSKSKEKPSASAQKKLDFRGVEEKESQPSSWGANYWRPPSKRTRDTNKDTTSDLPGTKRPKEESPPSQRGQEGTANKTQPSMPDNKDDAPASSSPFDMQNN